MRVQYHTNNHTCCLDLVWLKVPFSWFGDHNPIQLKKHVVSASSVLGVEILRWTTMRRYLISYFSARVVLGGPRTAQQKYLLVLKTFSFLGILFLIQKEKWVLKLKFVTVYKTFCSLHLVIWWETVMFGCLFASHYWENNPVPWWLAPRIHSHPRLQHKGSISGILGTETTESSGFTWILLLAKSWLWAPQSWARQWGRVGGWGDSRAYDLKIRREGDDRYIKMHIDLSHWEWEYFFFKNLNSEKKGPEGKTFSTPGHMKSQIPLRSCQSGPATKEIPLEWQSISGPRNKGNPCGYVKRKS